MSKPVRGRGRGRGGRRRGNSREFTSSEDDDRNSSAIALGKRSLPDAVSSQRPDNETVKHGRVSKPEQAPVSPAVGKLVQHVDLTRETEPQKVSNTGAKAASGGVNSSVTQNLKPNTQQQLNNKQSEKPVSQSVSDSSINSSIKPNNSSLEKAGAKHTDRQASNDLHCSLIIPRPSVMISAPLLSMFGGVAHQALVVLEKVFMIQSTYGSEHIVSGIHQLSIALQRSNDVHLALAREHEILIKRASDIHTDKERLEQLSHSSSTENRKLQGKIVELEKAITGLKAANTRKTTDDMSKVQDENRRLQAKNAELEKVVIELRSEAKNIRKTTDDMIKVQEENQTLKAKIAELESIALNTRTMMESRDSNISRLEVRLEEFKNKALASDSELSTIKGEKTKLDELVLSLHAELNDNKQNSNRLTAILSNLVDPVSKVRYQCPVIQNNGIVRSLDGIIQIWNSEPAMNTHALRMFRCPVAQSFAVIATFPVVDAFLKLQGALGINTNPPLTFQFKAADRDWTSFSFHDQLELIARLCNVYCNRQINGNPPEQLNASVAGMSLMITMRAVVSGSRWNLQCNGMQLTNSEQVEIRAVFDLSWTNPFTEMDFPNAGQ